MVWKCPKCQFKTTEYGKMQKHFFREHHKSKAKSVTKGKSNVVYKYKPPKFQKR